MAEDIVGAVVEAVVETAGNVVSEVATGANGNSNRQQNSTDGTQWVRTLLIFATCIGVTVGLIMLAM